MNDIEYCWFKNKLQQLILPSILIKTDVHTKYTNKYITTTNRISIYIYKVAYYLMQHERHLWRIYLNATLILRQEIFYLLN